MPKTHTPAPAAIMAWARLVRVSRQLVEKVEDELKAVELPPLAWYDALHELAEAGEGGLRPFQLMERMLLAQYNASRLIARLETAGLVEKGSVDGDGRGQSLQITASGLEMRRRIWAVYGRAIAELVAEKLTEAELATLSELLGRLREPPSI